MSVITSNPERDCTRDLTVSARWYSGIFDSSGGLTDLNLSQSLGPPRPEALSRGSAAAAAAIVPSGMWEVLRIRGGPNIDPNNRAVQGSCSEHTNPKKDSQIVVALQVLLATEVRCTSGTQMGHPQDISLNYT